MFCDVFASFASILENISKIKEEKEDKRVKLIREAITCSSKKEDNIGLSQEDTAIFEGDPSKGRTSNGMVMSHVKPSFYG
jgi:hypothetical protein